MLESLGLDSPFFWNHQNSQKPLVSRQFAGVCRKDGALPWHRMCKIGGATVLPPLPKQKKAKEGGSCAWASYGLPLNPGKEGPLQKKKKSKTHTDDFSPSLPVAAPS